MKDEAPIEPNPGDTQAFRIAYLVAGFLRNTLTNAENIELDKWVTASMDNQRLFERLIDEKNIDEGKKKFEGTDTAAALEAIKNKISFAPVEKKSAIRSVWPYVAAACLLSAVVMIWQIDKNKSDKKSVMIQTWPVDILPGANKAILTLSDGTKIALDSVKNGGIGLQGNIRINKLDSGQLAYRIVYPKTLIVAPTYNILSTPAGGQFAVVLPDGTKAWLNASSSLKYPTLFSGAKRTVELTGEAYFEVAKDPMFPFEVTCNGASVQVLGTHFNVNGYQDEPEVRVVLAEGAVKLNSVMLLKPGEAGIQTKTGNLSKRRTDMEMELAWKNGQFIFKETPIDVLMRQVARWYNAQVVYDATISEHFNAIIERNVPVSKLLHLLETTGAVHFRIENKKITVMK